MILQSSYISALQTRKNVEAATATQMFTMLNVLVDSLTGLERILTTPIPFSYSVHLWIVTWLYCLALPFQIVTPLGWIAIPGTVVASFIFFGFLVAGEEIENPFGYDKNDLNLDHFTQGIVKLGAFSFFLSFFLSTSCYEYGWLIWSRIASYYFCPCTRPNCLGVQDRRHDSV
jgi:predicted membrane chloride channel (bestrophin family)